MMLAIILDDTKRVNKRIQKNLDTLETLLTKKSPARNVPMLRDGQGRKGQ